MTRPSDQHVWDVYQTFERARVGQRGKDDSNSIEDTARELGIEYAEVKRVVIDRLFNRFSG